MTEKSKFFLQHEDVSRLFLYYFNFFLNLIEIQAFTLNCEYPTVKFWIISIRLLVFICCFLRKFKKKTNFFFENFHFAEEFGHFLMTRFWRKCFSLVIEFKNDKMVRAMCSAFQDTDTSWLKHFLFTFWYFVFKIWRTGFYC